MYTAVKGHTMEEKHTYLLLVEETRRWRKVCARGAHIVACAYDPGDHVAERTGVPLFAALVREAAWAFQDATDLYAGMIAAYAPPTAAISASSTRWGCDGVWSRVRSGMKCYLSCLHSYIV